MPELAEVAWFAQQWAPGVGDVVTEVICREKARIYRGAEMRALRQGLKGRRLTDFRTKGKQMLFVFEEHYLGVHLGMTGELLIGAADHTPGKHDHLVIRQARRTLVFRDPRMFGVVKFSAGAEPDWWTALPPEVLSKAFTQDAVARYAARRAGLPLKAFLLQQEMFPGIGNWMADEILWRSGLSPKKRAGTLKRKEIIMLWQEVRAVSRTAMKIIGSRWGDVPKSWLFHYRWRDGGKCPRDGTVLRREEIGGRTTAWCPACQSTVKPSADAAVRRRARRRLG
jgi:formamidopyrimidine-DNA glycosylase